ncbi:transcription-repair coupling factor [Paraferrimonas sedimenticola]|uniref:Transcription-repair-coupling factor n=1 Tax=Paraferrimonas sedimenticola TaxID=375674 RepID=A0AA37W0E1_9GAMM|nr:transcription-repair coupling factor [Paraferrimonas sedimenticola]GLP94887.1 transcription-repair-coupling factor [Paraferrimonas sedimenticola]
MKRQLNGVIGVAQALSVLQEAKEHSGTTLVLTQDAPSAIALHQELEYLASASAYSVSLFPDRETLPYDTFSPHQDIVSQRLKTLSQLGLSKQQVVILPISTALVRLPPLSFLSGHLFDLKPGAPYPLEAMRHRLVQSGYWQVEQVYAHGEFAVRGSIIDLFPMGSREPFRIELFDDEVETIRSFDPETQRSQDVIDEVAMLPAREFATDSESIEGFRKRYRERFANAPNAPESVYQQVSRGVMPAGIESYLPLFFDETISLFDYLSADTKLITVGDIEDQCRHYLDEIQSRFENYNVDSQRPLLRPDEIYLRFEELFAAIKPLPRLHLAADSEGRGRAAKVASLPNIEVNHKLKAPLTSLCDYLENAPRVCFSVESEGRKEALLSLLSPAGIRPEPFDHWQSFVDSKAKLGLIVSPLSHGVEITSPKMALVCETELFGRHVARQRRRERQHQVSADALVRNLAELKTGQAVVHLEHGVGRYLGLETLDTGGNAAEYLKLEYAAGALLYVPVTSLHLIGRYSGSQDEQVALTKLGGKAWDSAKRKAAEKVRDVAAELLDIYAKRELKPGQSITAPTEDYRKFAASFPFEETVDQEKAINQVMSDLASPRPMDRLVCGDVGFGKTEVAMRAAFVAVMAGRQVAILVPTTLLAQQHYQNFLDRFADWPVQIEVMSRFKTAKQQNEALEKLAQGKLDIIVGTHKLLQGDIKFDDLGLLIIDEEHRFGVRQKDRIKRLRANVDILTLTATPIPRTLNMAMSGIRDLSIIATPPARRLAVKTFVRERDDAVIKEAILREILRGGQAYFLHNNVETIEKTADELQALVPEARVVVAHGQMRERQLEQVMSDFYHQRFNLLVCTTIIETGIDVPSANTIIMDRADKFGLAQLHQLRGRVGRSHHQAYAYLLTPNPKRLTKDALKRLDAIGSLEDLGAGFMLATQDLEIRGAGELLGDEQSGHIAKIGFGLYMEMLEAAVEAIKDGKTDAMDLDQLLKQQCEMELRIPVLIPDDYIMDVNTRLNLYKRIANCTNAKQLDELQVEMIDRFGLLPQQTKNLISLTRDKARAAAIGIVKLDMHANGGSIEFGDNNRLDPSFIIGLLQSQPQIYRMDGPSKLKFTIATETAEQRLQLLDTMLTEFAKHLTGDLNS